MDIKVSAAKLFMNRAGGKWTPPKATQHTMTGLLMHIKLGRTWQLLFVTGLLVLPLPRTIHADEVGNFTVVSGLVDALREKAETPIPAQVGMGSFMRDIIRTKHRSRTQLRFIDDSTLNMGPDYMVEIKEYLFDADRKVRSGVLHSLRGTMRATVAKVGDDIQSRFEVETPTAIAAVRGTDFIVNIISSLVTEIIVLEGVVAVRNIDPAIKGEVLVKAGQRTRVVRGQSPTLPAYFAPEYAQLLINETTPGSTAPSAQAGLQSLAEVVPVPPPQISIPLPAKQQQPVVIRGKPVDTGLPPVQPPVTQTAPALLNAPQNQGAGCPPFCY